MGGSAEQSWLASTAGAGVKSFYSEIGVELPDRGGQEAAIRCFTNAAAHNRNDRTASCSVNLLTGLWSCQACSASGNAFQAAVSMGYDERKAADLARAHGLFMENKSSTGERKKRTLPTEPQFAKLRARLWANPRVVQRLVELKGWTPRGMRRCGLGWDGERVLFPVRDKKRKIVGVVRYSPNPKEGSPKALAWEGTKRGLFPHPEAFTKRRPIILCEGEPAAVSLVSAGFQACGIPGVNGWKREMPERLFGFRVFFMPDCDAAGRDLAQRVSESISLVRVIDMEPLRTDGWDPGDVFLEAGPRWGKYLLQQAVMT